MKNLLLVFLTTLLAGSLACAQTEPGRWKAGDQTVLNTPDRKAVNGFGGAIIVVENPTAFMEMWRKPDFPDFETVKIANRNSTVGAFIMFAGCKTGMNGKCDAVVDYSLIGPKGNVLGDSKDQIIWNDTPPPVENTHISKACLTMAFTERNLAGEYLVKAVVRDRNADIKFDLETSFQLK